MKKTIYSKMTVAIVIASLLLAVSCAKEENVFQAFDQERTVNGETRSAQTTTDPVEIYLAEYENHPVLLNKSITI